MLLVVLIIILLGIFPSFVCALIRIVAVARNPRRLARLLTRALHFLRVLVSKTPIKEGDNPRRIAVSPDVRNGTGGSAGWCFDSWKM